MASWFTRRRTLGAIITTIVIAAIAAGIALRATKRAAAEARDKEAVTLEFAATDVATLEPKVLSRWLHASGTLQPVNQTTVKSKVSGEVRQVTVREGEAVAVGQVLVRFDTSDLDAKLTERDVAPRSATVKAPAHGQTRFVLTFPDAH